MRRPKEQTPPRPGTTELIASITAIIPHDRGGGDDDDAGDADKLPVYVRTRDLIKAGLAGSPTQLIRLIDEQGFPAGRSPQRQCPRVDHHRGARLARLEAGGTQGRCSAIAGGACARRNQTCRDDGKSAARPQALMKPLPPKKRTPRPDGSGRF